MSNEKVNIHLHGDQKEVIIREGEALPLQEPSTLIVNAQISAPAVFFAHRRELIDPKKAVVMVNRENLTINMLVDPVDPYGTIINGKLEISPDLKKFGINENVTYSRDQIASLLKINRFFFRDKDAHLTLLNQIKNFKANVQSDIQQSSDNRGNKTNNLVKAVTTDVPFHFDLEIPIFKGDKSSSFAVEICFDVTDGSTKFWLESVELHEILIRKRDEIFESQLKMFEGLVIIEQ